MTFIEYILKILKPNLVTNATSLDYMKFFKSLFDDVTSELHDPNARKSHLRNKKKRPNREHRCGAGRIPSED